MRLSSFSTCCLLNQLLCLGHILTSIIAPAVALVCVFLLVSCTEHCAQHWMLPAKFYTHSEPSSCVCYSTWFYTRSSSLYEPQVILWMLGVLVCHLPFINSPEKCMELYPTITKYKFQFQLSSCSHTHPQTVSPAHTCSLSIYLSPCVSFFFS